MNFTYTDLLNTTFSHTGNSPFMDKIMPPQTVLSDNKVRGFIIQYEETDWTFAKRIASHFNAYVFSEPATDYGRFYMGTPGISYGTVIYKRDITTVRNNRLHEILSARIQNTYVENIVNWIITDVDRLFMGEKLIFNDLECIVTGIEIAQEKELVKYKYTLQRAGSLKTPIRFNQKLHGLSLPAIVKECNGNTVKVNFLIDKIYNKKSTDVDFLYNIESQDWYCMPEEESKIHIHFATDDEALTYATHAVRIATDADQYFGRTVNTSHKSFSNVDGGEMLMTPVDISFAPNDDKAIIMKMGKDGIINVKGDNIELKADLEDIDIGQREKPGMSAEDIEKLVIPKKVYVYGEEKTTIKRNDSHIIEIEKDQTKFAATKIVKEGVEEANLSHDEEVAELTADDKAHILGIDKTSSEKRIENEVQYISNNIDESINSMLEAKRMYQEQISMDRALGYAVPSVEEEAKIMASYDLAIEDLENWKREEIARLTQPNYVPPNQRHYQGLADSAYDDYSMLNDANSYQQDTIQRVMRTKKQVLDFASGDVVEVDTVTYGKSLAVDE